MAARKRKRPVKGHTVEKGIDNFSEEVGSIGDNLEKALDRNCQNAKGWFRSTFGLIGPLLSSVLGIIILAALIWLLSVVNMPIGSELLQNLHYFLMLHVGWFFLILLFFSYSSYLTGNFPKACRLFSPITSAAGITIGLWLAAEMISIANRSLDIDMLAGIVFFIRSSLFILFWLFLLLGYLILLLNSMERKTQKKKPPSRVKKLYRSGNNRLLGGICGGIAEYLEVDPLVIRVLWLIITLPWGFGAFLYFILWILMPRNPRQKWN